MLSVLLLIIVLVVLGFTTRVFWWIAAILAVVWLVGFVLRFGAGRSWYRW
jgi:hypothetical protein